MKHSNRQSGFTLLELMVALVAGMIAITTIYFLGSASSHHFQEQQRIAQTQMSLRMAMEQMRADIQRAGYLGTPNSLQEVRCQSPPPNYEIQAVEFEDDADTNQLPNAAENGATADRLRLVGNYATGDSYLAIGLDATGSTVFLQKTWQAFRRDFPTAQDFTDVFRPGRMLHIKTLEGQSFFVTITGGANWLRGTIPFTPSIGVGGTCVGGLADGAMVAPLSRIEYRVVSQLQNGQSLQPVGGATTASQSYRGEASSVLVRREIAFDSTNAPITNADGSVFERIVLEYVSFVDYQFVVDNQINTGQPPSLSIIKGAPAALQLANINTSPGARPETVRSVILTLSARAAEQDPRFPWVISARGNPLTGLAPTRYKVNPSSTYPGAARVRTLHAEIFLPNVANRMMRP